MSRQPSDVQYVPFSFVWNGVRGEVVVSRAKRGVVQVPRASSWLRFVNHGSTVRLIQGSFGQSLKSAGFNAWKMLNKRSTFLVLAHDVNENV